MVWNKTIFPDGQSWDFEGMEGADLVGLAGLDDLVDNHYLRLFGSVIAMSVFSTTAQLSQQGFWNNNTPNNTTNYNTGSIMAGALGQQINQIGAKLMEKNINMQTTIYNRPGCNFNVLLTRDIPFKQKYKWGNMMRKIINQRKYNL